MVACAKPFIIFTENFIFISSDFFGSIFGDVLELGFNSFDGKIYFTVWFVFLDHVYFRFFGFFSCYFIFVVGSAL